MATLTLRPNGAGNQQGWDAEGGDYTRVDEVISDGDTTRLYTPTDNKVATFAMQDHTSETGTINSVTVYLNTRGLDPISNDVQLAIRTNSTDYFSSTQNYNNTSYHEESNVWSTNPNTASAWTWSEIDALEAGMKRITGGGQAVTQVWMVVDYSAGVDVTPSSDSIPISNPSVTVSLGVSVETSACVVNVLNPSVSVVTQVVAAASSTPPDDKSLYKVVITQKDGTEIGEIINFTSISFDKRLNNYGKCIIKLPLNEPELDSLISLRNYEVKILRNDTVVWAGEQVHLTGNISKKSIEPVTLTCFDYLELFNSRFTGAIDIYSGIDAGAIAWSLIDDSQSLTDGDFGITQGNIETTINRDRSYYNQNIMDAIIKLSNVVNGFDFEVTDEKVFNVYSKKGVDRSSEVVFQYGLNMNNISIESDFSKPANEGIALGEGFASEQLRETSVDTSLRAAHKLRQGVVSDPSISVSATLTDKADELIRRNKQSIINVKFEQVQNSVPLFGTLTLGDSVKIIINKGIFDINNVFRIYAFNVKLDSKGKETVKYLVSLLT